MFPDRLNRLAMPSVELQKLDFRDTINDFLSVILFFLQMKSDILLLLVGNCVCYQFSTDNLKTSDYF